MKRHQNYMTRALQSKDPRYAQVLTALGYPMPAGEIEIKAVEPLGGERTVSVVHIPEDWADMHWSRQAKLAEEIAGSEDALDAAEGHTKAAKAKTIIEAELARRAE